MIFILSEVSEVKTNHINTSDFIRPNYCILKIDVVYCIYVIFTLQCSTKIYSFASSNCG